MRQNLFLDARHDDKPRYLRGGRKIMGDTILPGVDYITTDPSKTDSVPYLRTAIRLVEIHPLLRTESRDSHSESRDSISKEKIKKLLKVRRIWREMLVTQPPVLNANVNVLAYSFLDRNDMICSTREMPDCNSTRIRPVLEYVFDILKHAEQGYFALGGVSRRGVRFEWPGIELYDCGWSTSFLRNYERTPEDKALFNLRILGGNAWIDSAAKECTKARDAQTEQRSAEHDTSEIAA